MAHSTKKIPADDLLDWTITHAPTDDEPGNPQALPRKMAGGMCYNARWSPAP